MKTSHTLSSVALAPAVTSFGSVDPQMQDLLARTIAMGVQNGISELMEPLQQKIQQLSDCLAQTNAARSMTSSLSGPARPSYSTQGSTYRDDSMTNLQSRLVALEKLLASYPQQAQGSMNGVPLWARPCLQKCNYSTDTNLIVSAISLYGCQIVEKELSRTEVDLDVVVQGLGANFINAFPLVGAKKLRLRQQDGVILPFFPGKTSITFGWKAGDEPQPERLLLKWFTGLRGNPLSVYEWVENTKQTGALYTCGEQTGACYEVDFPTPKYCPPGPVGTECYLYLEIEGKATLTSTLENVAVTVRFAESSHGCGCEACTHGNPSCCAGTGVVPG